MDHQVETNMASNVYTPLQTNKKDPYSTFEIRLLLHLPHSTIFKVHLPLSTNSLYILVKLETCSIHKALHIRPCLLNMLSMVRQRASQWTRHVGGNNLFLDS
jgi:hypothetical protein